MSRLERKKTWKPMHFQAGQIFLFDMIDDVLMEQWYLTLDEYNKVVDNLEVPELLTDPGETITEIKQTMNEIDRILRD